MTSAHVIFEVNQTKIKGGCQSGRKVVPHDSKSDLPLHRNGITAPLVYLSRVSTTIESIPILTMRAPFAIVRIKYTVVSGLSKYNPGNHAC